MSKLGCVCGHTIRDQTDFLPYKAYIRKDKDTQKPIENLVEALMGFIEARNHGEQRQFLVEQLIDQGDSLKMAELWVDSFVDVHDPRKMLYELIFPFWNNYDRVIYECEACGRLWVELEGNHFAPYLPETDSRSVL